MHRVAEDRFNVARLAESGACHVNAEPDTERRESLDSQDGVHPVGNSYEPTPNAAPTVTPYGAWEPEAGRTRGAGGAGAAPRGEPPAPAEHVTGRGPMKPREPRACGIHATQRLKRGKTHPLRTVFGYVKIECVIFTLYGK